MVQEVLTTTGTGPWTRRCLREEGVAEDPRLSVVTEVSREEDLEPGMVLVVLRDRQVRGQEDGMTGTDNNLMRMSMVLLAQGDNLIIKPFTFQSQKFNFTITCTTSRFSHP